MRLDLSVTKRPPSAMTTVAVTDPNPRVPNSEPLSPLRRDRTSTSVN
jgi:hypothetical protein